MAKNTSILLGERYENFIRGQIESGRYSSVSEVVRTALRILEQQENKTALLVNLLVNGENSKKIRNFDMKKNLDKLKAVYQKNG